MRKTEDGSKKYRGIHTDRKGEQHEIIVKITNALTLAVSTLGIIFIIGTTVTGAIEDKRRENGKYPQPEKKQDPVVKVVDNSETVDHTKEEVERIIKEHPYLLKNIREENYVVEPGDTLGDIAEKAGNTVKRICEINGINRDATIYPGENYKLEVLEDKDELDKELACLESYFGDLVLNFDVNNRYVGYIRGTSSNGTVDPNSVYGRFMKLYTDYRTKLEIPTYDKEELKKEYVDNLLILAKEVDNKINIIDGVFDITPYYRYKIYMENGTTEFDKINEAIHSIYG